MARFLTDAPEAAAGIDVVLAASAFETLRDRIPGAELLQMAGAILRHPGPAYLVSCAAVEQIVTEANVD